MIWHPRLNDKEPDATVSLCFAVCQVAVLGAVVVSGMSWLRRCW